MALNATQYGAFIPTTTVWDVSQIYSTDINSPEFKELLVRLYQNLNNMALLLNIKDTGYYINQEFVCSQAYFSNPALNSLSTTNPVLRQVYRLVINFGALPDNTTTSIPHGITTTTSTSFTRIYATASDPIGMTYIPIPYVSQTEANEIELNVDSTYVNIITAADYSAYTICYVVLEYIQS